MGYATGKALDPAWEAPQPGEEAAACEPSGLARMLREYYGNRTVRERMWEFLGGTDPETATAANIVGNDGFSDYSQPSSAASLDEYLRDGQEIDRSLWDHDCLIADIDIEYHIFDYPAAPWFDPQRAFKLQEPVLEATLSLLRRSGVTPLTLVSGRGFHLVWAISRKSKAFYRLACLGRLPSSLQTRYTQSRAPNGASVDSQLGRAFAGLGLVLEYVGHGVLRESAETCTIPVQPAAIEVGPGIHEREIISFDLSEYGDPLHTRHIRLPFSAYLKPRHYQWMLGEAGVSHLLPIFTIPLSGMSPLQAIETARNPDQVLKLSRHASVRIPNASEGMENLLDEYDHSELAGSSRDSMTGC